MLQRYAGKVKLLIGVYFNFQGGCCILFFLLLRVGILIIIE